MSSTSTSVTATAATSRRRRRASSYSRLEVYKKAQLRSKYLTAGAMGLLLLVLLVSLGVIAFELAS